MCVEEERDRVKEGFLQEAHDIRTHFWKEDEHEDILGKRYPLATEKKNSLLRNLTEIVNLEEVREEWSHVH